MNRAPAAIVLSLVLLAGCTGGASQPVNPAKTADTAIVAKLNYVCAYSGLFKFADKAASYVLPVPGVAAGVDLVNSGIDQACLHPQTVADDIQAVQGLIAKFRAIGRM